MTNVLTETEIDAALANIVGEMNDDIHLIVHDLFGIALHEAAHLAMAHSFGVSGEIRIALDLECNPHDEKVVIGQIMFWSLPNDDWSQRVIGLAGEMSDHLTSYYYTDGGDFMDCWDPQAMSPTDAEMVGEVTEELADACAERLRANWHHVLELALEVVLEENDLGLLFPDAVTRVANRLRKMQTTFGPQWPWSPVVW